MGTVTRPTKILVALAAVVLVGGVVALWVEWRGSALPDDDTLAARIVESVGPDTGTVKPGIAPAFFLWREAARERRIMLNGWEFSAELSRPLPPDSLTFWCLPFCAVDATPVTPMAKLRVWLGAYPGRWKPSQR